MNKPNALSDMKVMFPDEVKDYMDEHQEGSYTLLDVRQPAEYELTHLPGARLIPLPELADSIGAIDPRKPTIVYCAAGGRSRMAVQLLMNHGLGEVYNMQGGINAWEEPTAASPMEFHLRFIRGDEKPDEAISIACRMEQGLKRFHREILSRSTDAQLSNLLYHLVSAEESHERTLLGLLSDPKLRDEISRGIENDPDASLMEGGIDFQQFMRENEPFLNDVQGYLNVAMMIETQALDLYLRMAASSSDENTRKVLFRISEEEKSHLAALGRVMDDSVRALPSPRAGSLGG